MNTEPKTSQNTDVTAARLKSFIERIESLSEEKQGIADDIKNVFAEAKGTGFEVKIMKAIIKLRKLTPSDRQEQGELLETYKAAVGLA